ncbi:Ubiquitin-conjugating enzyme/RWD-like [Trinorchestia longiramus]|nr:Ubiquitin-conjugating enzyme/RWD-like [Trinorchestia longiramus]
MGFIEDELQEIKGMVERHINGSKLEACIPAMVRVNIRRTKYKQLVVCLQFPDNYPHANILVELKSKYISQKLLDGLAKLAEKEAKQIAGKPQILHVLKFIRNFIDENPLCCCSEEISVLKQKIARPCDEIKLKQKTSSIIAIASEGKYCAKYSIAIPEDYPDTRVSLQEVSSNYPPVIKRWLLAQSHELARQCVEPPSKPRPKDPPFVLKPSLLPVLKFLLENLHSIPATVCGVCSIACLPEDPDETPCSEDAPMAVERVYCGHLYHHDCLDTYIRTPPFTGGKKCHSCSLRIYHDKWKLSPALVEARWAHKQARQRELDEAIDFFA